MNNSLNIILPESTTARHTDRATKLTCTFASADLSQASPNKPLQLTSQSKSLPSQQPLPLPLYLLRKQTPIGGALSFERLFRLHEVGLHLYHQLLLQGLDGLLETRDLTVPGLNPSEVLLHLLLVRGQLHSLGLKLIAVVLQHLQGQP